MLHIIYNNIFCKQAARQLAWDPSAYSELTDDKILALFLYEQYTSPELRRQFRYIKNNPDAKRIFLLYAKNPTDDITSAELLLNKASNKYNKIINNTPNPEAVDTSAPKPFSDNYNAATGVRLNWLSHIQGAKDFKTFLDVFLPGFATKTAWVLAGHNRNDLLGSNLDLRAHTARTIMKNVTPLVAAALANTDDAQFELQKTRFDKIFGSQLNNNAGSTKISLAAAGQLLNNIQSVDKPAKKLDYIYNLSRVMPRLNLDGGGLASKALNQHIKDTVTKLVWSAIGEEWTLINKAIAIWAQNKGWTGFAKFANNSLAFYGTLAGAIAIPSLALLAGTTGSRRPPADNTYVTQQASSGSAGMQYGYYG